MEMALQDISSPKDHSLATYVSLSFALEIYLEQNIILQALWSLSNIRTKPRPFSENLQSRPKYFEEILR